MWLFNAVFAYLFIVQYICNVCRAVGMNAQLQ